MFRTALGFSTRPPEGGRSVLVGGLLLIVIGVGVGAGGLGVEFLPLALIAILPWLLVRGYYVRVIRASIGHERPVPPRFGGYRRLFTDGLKAVVVAVLYVLPAVAVLGPLVYVQVAGLDLTVLLGGAGVPSGLMPAALSVLGILAIFALMSLIGALYAIPVAVANFAYTERFGAAFEFRTVFDASLTEDYVVAWFVSLLLQVLVLPVAYLLRILLVGFFLQFIVAMGVRYCYGQGFGAALDLEPVVPLPDTSDEKAPETPSREPKPAFVPIHSAETERGWTTGGASERARPTLEPATDPAATEESTETDSESVDNTGDRPADPGESTPKGDTTQRPPEERRPDPEPDSTASEDADSEPGSEHRPEK